MNNSFYNQNNTNNYNQQTYGQNGYQVPPQNNYEPTMTQSYQNEPKKGKNTVVIIIVIIVISLFLCCLLPLVGSCILNQYLKNTAMESTHEVGSGLSSSIDEFSTSQNINNNSLATLADMVFESVSEEDSIYFYDNDFIWYSDSNMTTYLYGQYEVYYDADAMLFISDELEEYGVTYSEQLNSLDMYGDYENYVCLVFYPKNMTENGETTTEGFSKKIPFFGFSKKKDGVLYYDIANMNTASYKMFKVR